MEGINSAATMTNIAASPDPLADNPTKLKNQ
jgi:hypothetical protein